MSGRRVEITLFGGFAVVVDGVPVASDSWVRPQAASLVKVLALAPGHRLHREQLIDRLWPELTIADAASSPYTLRVMTWVALFGAPAVLVYQGWTYWVFRKRIGTHHIPKAHVPQ